MSNQIKRLIQGIQAEKGQTLVLALIIVFFSTLAVTSLLSYVGTSLKISKGVTSPKSSELYAAGAGVSNAEWRIKYGNLESVYSPFDFINSYEYTLEEIINDSTVTTRIKNVWIPHDAEGPYPVPDQTNARRLIMGVAGAPPKIIIRSNMTAPSSPLTTGTGIIKVQYYYTNTTEDLRITTLGIWLPNGYRYDTLSPSTINSYAINGRPVIVPYNGGQSIIWQFNNYPFKGNAATQLPAFPRNQDGDPLNPNQASPLVSNIHFSFFADSPNLSSPVAWVKTNQDLTMGGIPPVNFTWDGSISVYHIESKANNINTINTKGTQIDAFLTRSQTREIGNSIGGDYYATGASLLKGNTSDLARYTWVTPVPAVTVNSSHIPPDADIGKAFLYWSAWKNQDGVNTSLLNDTGINFNNWNRSGTSPYTNTTWNTNGSNFIARYQAGGEVARYLTLKNGINLSTYQPGSVTISWNQWVSALSTLFSDPCDNFNNWNNGNAWSATGGKFVGSTFGKTNPGRDLSIKTVRDLSTLGAAGTIRIAWDQSITLPGQVTIFTDNCSTSTNLANNWIAGADWTYNAAGQNYAGAHKAANSESDRFLTLKNTLGLSHYGAGMINISMDPPILAAAPPSGVPPLNPDPCNSFSNWDAGAAWSMDSGTFKANGVGKSGSDRELKLKNNILDLSPYGVTGTVNVSLDTPTLAAVSPISVSPLNPDTCDNFNNWVLANSWFLDNGRFRGRNNSTGLELVVKPNLLNLSSLGTTGNISVSFSASQSGARGSDGLDFAYSLNGGSTWTTSQVFRGSNTPVSSVNINNVSLPNNFLIKFILVSFTGTRDCFLDNIHIRVTPAYSGNDGLDFSYSTDGGSNWVTHQVFRGSGSPTTSWSMPNLVLNNRFLIKFTLVGFEAAWKNVFIDNIRVNVVINYTSQDGLDMAYSLDGGVSWTTRQVFRGTGSPVVNWDIPFDKNKNQLRIRYYLVGFNSGWQRCNLDNFSIKVTPDFSSADGLDFSYSLNEGVTWTTKKIFRGPDIPPSANSLDINFDTTKNKLLYRFTLVGFNHSGQNCALDNITITSTYSDTDALYYSFSNDGVNWSTPANLAFSGNIGSVPKNFSQVIPVSYLTSSFRFRFYLAGFEGTGKLCNLDDIKISIMRPNETIQFSINGNQVSFDANGNPRLGGHLKSTRTQVIQNFTINPPAAPNPSGYSYSCFVDVTDLVRRYTSKTPGGNNYPGYGTYAVNGVDADTSNPNGSRNEYSYAGWSIILIYSSPATKGHQIYLFDTFVHSQQEKTNGVNVDFDLDGQPGGIISGFIVPEPSPGEINAGKITVFVGEGDEAYSGDFLALNAPPNYWSYARDIPDYYKLWDGTVSPIPTMDTSNNNPQPNSKSSPNNVWNGKSLGMVEDGIDIDTLGIDPANGQYITWSSGLLKPGDTSAHISLFTKTDGWNLIYLILSFRSVATTGIALNYIIK